jgi:hydrogenase expression/formation protein HypC
MCIGVPARIVAVDEREGVRLGTVEFGDCLRQIYLAYVPDAQAGEYVIVHSGFAVDRVDASLAAAICAALDQARGLE